jgi:hypothetical protein
MGFEKKQQTSTRFSPPTSFWIFGTKTHDNPILKGKFIFFQTPAGRKNFRQMLSENGSNRHRLLYELALTCAQVAQVEQFELVVPAIISEVHWGCHLKRFTYFLIPKG